MAEALPREDVRDVDFHRRDFDPDQGIVECDRGVRITARIDDDARGFLGAGLMHEVDQLALAVGLAAIGGQAITGRALVAELLHVGERVMAVGFRLAGAEQIQVRPIEHVNRLCHPKTKSNNVGENDAAIRSFGGL